MSGFGGGSPSTFVLVSMLDKKGNRQESKRSHTSRKDENPHWDMQLVFDVDGTVDQIELAIYDREGIIVDELVGTVTLPHQRITPQMGIIDTWLPVQPVGKTSFLAIASSNPSHAAEIFVTIKYVDSETKTLIETTQKAKSDTRQRRKEMKKLFNLDEEYLHDFSCNLDHGTIPGFGRVYITSTKLLYNSTFKQKSIDLDQIRSIAKYKTLLLANAGITLFLKNGRKIHLKSFKHRKTFIAALQSQIKLLGLPSLPIVDQSTSEEQNTEQDSDEEVDTGVTPRLAFDAPSNPSPTPSFIPVHTPSPIQSSDVAVSASPPLSVIVSAPNSLKRSSSAKLRDSGGHYEPTDKREKDSHKRTPSAVAASIVRSVSDKLRNISSSSNNLSQSKTADASLAVQTPLQSSDGSSGGTQGPTPPREISFSSALVTPVPSSSAPTTSSIAPHALNQSAPNTNTLTVKPKEKSSIFPSVLKDLSLPFHLPGSKRKQSLSSAPSAETPSPETNPLAADSQSSSESEMDQSDIEREQSHRLKYYLIHGEVPAGSGEEESDLESSKTRINKSLLRPLKQATSSIQRSAIISKDSEHSSADAFGEAVRAGKLSPEIGFISNSVGPHSTETPSLPTSVNETPTTTGTPSGSESSSSYDDLFHSPRTDISSATTTPRHSGQYAASGANNLVSVPVELHQPLTPGRNFVHPLLTPINLALHHSAPVAAPKVLDDSDRSEDLDLPSMASKRAGANTYSLSMAQRPVTHHGHARLVSTSAAVGSSAAGDAKLDSLLASSSMPQFPALGRSISIPLSAGSSSNRLKRSMDSDLVHTAVDESSSDSIAGSADQSLPSPVRQRRASHTQHTRATSSSASTTVRASAQSGDKIGASLGLSSASSASLNVNGTRKRGMKSSSSKTGLSELADSTGSKSRSRRASSSSTGASSASSTASATEIASSHGSASTKRKKSANLRSLMRERSFLQQLPSLMLKTGLFSFILALAILLRASNPHSLLHHSAHASPHTGTNHASYASSQAPKRSSPTHSPYEFLGLATTAALGAIVAQSIAVLFANLDQPRTHWTHHFAHHSNPIVREHLLPFGILIAGHIILLATAHILFALSHFFGTTETSVHLLGPNTCILYVLFCSIGCHLIAKRQASADE